ncbi:MAG: DMT family transporter [Alphaproteobacteria bacterium]|jgi:drug/metabolite transporter (DMT)-like permease|nr:DMT family transporter [Alphaproteobacteria bacterium]MDP6588069.1 DMT family transporter [Alphaproteobacteria bacterium]
MTWPGTAYPLRGLALLLAVGLFWGFNWPVMKVGMAAIPVFTFRAITIFLGGLCLAAICRYMGYSLKVPRAQWPPLLLVTLLIFGFTVLSGYGVLETGSGRAAVMAYTMPVWAIPLGALFLADPLTWRKLASLALGLAGMTLLVVADIETLGGAPIGILIMLVTAILWAGATIVHKKAAWTVPTLVLVAWQSLLSSVPLSIGAVLVDYETVEFPGLWPILCLLYNIFIAATFCLYAYFEVVRIFPVGITTIGVLIAPVVGVFSGAFTLGEPLGVAEFGALALVLAAIALPVMARKGAFK